MNYKSKADIVYESIKKNIEKNAFLPGDKLTISRIAKVYGCSEVPVREALQRLQGEGLIEFIPNKGAVVPHARRNNLQDLAAVQAALESYAVRLSIDNLSESQLRKLHNLADEMYEAYSHDDMGRASKLHYNFHMTIYRASGNEVLVKYIEDTWKKVPHGDPQLFLLDDWYPIAMQQHLDLLSAIEAKDYEGAEAIIRIHKYRTKTK